MGRTMVFSSALAVALFGFAGQAYAGDDPDEEVVPQARAGRGEKVQVIVVNGDESVGPRRRHRARKIEAVDGERPPAGYHRETTSLRGVWIAGISLFASSYVLSILSGGIADAVEGHEGGRYTWYSLIPAAGPFIIAGHGEISPVAKVVPFILCGVMETAGLGMFIGGLAAHKDVWVSDEARLDPELFVGPGSIGVRQKF